MQYNVDKGHFLRVGKNNSKFEYSLGGRNLEASKWEKDVGVIINEDLKPSLQCARAASKPISFYLFNLGEGSLKL